MKKDESGIPKGAYCYTYENGKFIVCPYWDTIEGAPEQADGYCHFLEKGDLDIEKEMVLKDMKTGEETRGDELPFPVSLLWDQCKECGIKNNYSEDELI